jgi:hypothetical protein
MSQFIKDTTKASDPYYIRLIKGEDKQMPDITGNNASFGGGGSMAGSFATNATNVLKSATTDYKYTGAGVSSLNDYFGYLFSVPYGSRGQTCSFKFNYNTISTNFMLVAKDVTNNALISGAVAMAAGNTVYEYLLQIPATCASVQIGWQYIGNSTETLQLDNIVFSMWSAQTANLVIQEAISYTGYTSGTNPIVFKTLDTTRSNSSKLISGTTSRFTVLQNSQCNISSSVPLSGAGSYIRIYHYNSSNVEIKSSYPSQSSSTNNNATSMTTFASVGDYFIVATNGTPSDGVYTYFSITAQAISSNIIQTWQDGTEWKALTFTEVNALTGNQGLGTFTAGGVEWMRGKDGLLHYKGKLTLGTVSASEARIPYPAGLIAAGTDKIPSIQIAGLISRSDVGAATFNSLVEPSLGYFTMGYTSASTGGLTKVNGNTSSSGSQISFNFTVPIAGWSNSPTLLALPTATQTDYYIEAAGNAGQAITASVTDIPFIATVQNNLTWDGSGFTAPISGNYEVVGYVKTTATAVGLRATINGTIGKQIGTSYSGSTMFLTGKVYLTQGQRFSLRGDSTATLSNDSNFHHIAITRLNGKNDSVLVSNWVPDYQYDLTVSGTGWTTVRAVGVPYKTGNGSYRMKFNIVGTVTSQTSNTLTVSGVTFKNVSNYDQAVVVLANNAQIGTGYAAASSSTIQINTGSAFTRWSISGDVELENRPSWATFLP